MGFDVIASALSGRSADTAALNWDDLGVTLPSPDEIRVAPDDGSMPSLLEGDIEVHSPSGEVFTPFSTCDNDDEPGEVSIDVSWEFEAAVPGFSGSVTVTIECGDEQLDGEFAFEQEIDCGRCAEYEAAPPDPDSYLAELDGQLEEVIVEMLDALREVQADADPDDEDVA